MTEKLFYLDCYLREFAARVVRRTVAGRHPAIVLDRTAFYPTSGGQPHDTGTVNGVAVVDVLEDEATGDVVHVLEGDIGEEQVRGSIDWERRFDHMQQHTGQHILSQAFERVLNAPTVSFHLGVDICTIDVQLEAMTGDEASCVEDLANSVVFEDRQVRIHLVGRDDIGRFPLRKPPVVEGTVRIVEVEGFDFSPCGGTHVRRAGELGVIKIRRWERRGDSVRVEFHCGRRALADYRWKNEAVNRLAAALSVRDREMVEAVERSLAQGREHFRLLEEAQSLAVELEARALAAETPSECGMRVVVRAFRDRGGEDVRRLAMALATMPATVGLLGLRSGDRASLIFARSPDLAHDMTALLRNVVPLIGGRGGGTPALAQGGGPGVDKLETALVTARDLLLQR